MLERELDGFVVVDLPSVRWLTGFTGSNGLAVISAEALVWPPTAVTRHRRLRSSRPQAAMPPSSSPRTSLPVVPMGSRVQLRVALEGDVISWDQQRQWAAALADSESSWPSLLLRELRSVKDPAELAASRRQRRSPTLRSPTRRRCGCPARPSGSSGLRSTTPCGPRVRPVRHTRRSSRRVQRRVAACSPERSGI